MASDKDSLSELIGERYKVGAAIGRGSYGQLHRGTHLDTREECAIKLEKMDVEHKQLPLEYRFYKMLGTAKGVPQMYFFGNYKHKYNALVMELLGPTLEAAFEQCQRKFSLKTMCMMSIQMLQRIEFVHSKNILWRDVKTENFLLGNPDNAITRNTIYVIDFGLAKEYIEEDGQHIPYRTGKPMTGTARYTSVNSHLGCEQSRRDDLEAIGYVIIYFLLGGKLPWMGLNSEGSTKARYSRIGEVKRTTDIAKLCDGHPTEFSEYLKIVKALKFEEKPDYAKLRGLFTKVLQKNNLTADNVYDWNV